jgi:hypothetical protein
MRTRLGLVRRLSLLGSGLLGEFPSDSATHIMSPLFDGSEIELADVLVGSEDVLRDFREKLIEP